MPFSSEYGDVWRNIKFTSGHPDDGLQARIKEFGASCYHGVRCTYIPTSPSLNYSFPGY